MLPPAESGKRGDRLCPECREIPEGEGDAKLDRVRGGRNPLLLQVGHRAGVQGVVGVGMKVLVNPRGDRHRGQAHPEQKHPEHNPPTTERLKGMTGQMRHRAVNRTKHSPAQAL